MSEILEAIKKAQNLCSIKTAIEVIRKLDRYKNYQQYNYEYEVISPQYYPIYKDLHAVEQFLINEYTADLHHINWIMYAYITNRTQEALFREREDLRKLALVMRNTILLNGLKDIQGSYEDVKYISQGKEIHEGFYNMITWLFSREYDPIYKREAYNSGFLK